LRNEIVDFAIEIDGGSAGWLPSSAVLKEQTERGSCERLPDVESGWEEDIERVEFAYEDAPSDDHN